MKADAEHGFALIEAVVALAILVLGLAAVYQAFAGGALGLRVADREAAALQVARQQLAGAGKLAPLTAGRSEGEADGFAWTIETRPYEQGAAPRGSGLPAAFWVTAEVRWRDAVFRPERRLSLTTLKLAAAP
jgi:prepilin-type N-terminal cleavage/methylation domain-containing protein